MPSTMITQLISHEFENNICMYQFSKNITELVDSKKIIPHKITAITDVQLFSFSLSLSRSLSFHLCLFPPSSLSFHLCLFSSLSLFIFIFISLHLCLSFSFFLLTISLSLSCLCSLILSSCLFLSMAMIMTTRSVGYPCTHSSDFP